MGVAVAVAAVLVVALGLAAYARLGGGNGFGTFDDADGGSRSKGFAVLREETSEEALDSSDATQEPQELPTIDAAALQQIDAAQDAPAAFSLGGEAAPEVDEASLAALRAAIDAARADGEAEVGCIALSLETGRGVAFNLDARVYGASSFKGPYCAYLYERMADEELGGIGLGEYERSLVASAIEYSDNDSYAALRMTYDGEGFASWLEENGVSGELMSDTWYPHYSARESALLWLAAYRYLEQGTAAGQELAAHLGSTNLSPIRDAAAAQGEGWEVLDKAGWIAEPPDFSMSDAGIVRTAEGAYLISVMTSQPADDEAIRNTTAIAQALLSIAPTL